jgi:hypothetical protein
MAVQLIRSGSASVLDHDDGETFVGEAADGGGHALIGEDAAADDLRDAQIVEDQPQIGTGEGAVGGLGDDDLVPCRESDRRVPVPVGSTASESLFSKKFGVMRA